MLYLRLDSRDGRQLYWYDASASHVNVYLLQWCLQCLPLTSGVVSQMTVVNVVPQIEWKVCID